MIDEMMTLLERDDEAKALTRQITGHKDLLSSRDAHIQPCGSRFLSSMRA